MKIWCYLLMLWLIDLFCMHTSTSMLYYIATIDTNYNIGIITFWL